MTTTLDAAWWQKVASMNRRELLDALVLSEEALLDTQDTLEKVSTAVAKLESVVIAHNRGEADLSLARLGRGNAGVTFISSDSMYGEQSLRGLKLENDHVLLIPGWGRGRYADQIRQSLAACGVKWQNCRIAPSPESDRAEGLSNWGRTEAATVDDMLSTVSKLMDRALARTSES